MHPSHPSPDGLSFNTMFKLFLKRQLLNKLKDEIGETQLCVNQGWQVNLWAENQKFIFLKFKLIIFCKIYQARSITEVLHNKREQYYPATQWNCLCSIWHLNDTYGNLCDTFTSLTQYFFIWEIGDIYRQSPGKTPDIKT